VAGKSGVGIRYDVPLIPSGEKPKTLYRVPKTQFIDLRPGKKEQDTTIYLSFQLSQWNNKHIQSIARIHESVLLLKWFVGPCGSAI
jgi:hypothetical protein